MTLPCREPTPVCSPGAPASVPLAAPAPAVPLGVWPAESSPFTTVSAVTVLFPPFGNVAVLSETDVLEGRRLLEPDEVTVSEEALGEPEAEMVRTPPPTVVITVKPSALVVVRTSPALGDDESVGEGDSEGGAVLAAGLSRDVLVEDTVTGPEPASVVVPASAVVGPAGAGAATSGVEPGAASVGDEETGAAGEVPLSARLASCTTDEARLASSRWRTSTADRSCEKMPSRNLFGEMSWRAEWSLEGSTSSKSF